MKVKEIKENKCCTRLFTIGDGSSCGAIGSFKITKYKKKHKSNKVEKIVANVSQV